MKKIWKRSVAALCAVAMLVGAGFSELIPTEMVKAATNNDASFTIMTSTNGENIVNSSNQAYYLKNNVNINLPTDLQNKSELELYVKIWLEDQTAIDVIKTTYMELANDVCDVQELYWWLGNYSFHVGMNELRFDLPSGNNYPGTGGVPFEPSQTINWFRIFMGTTDNTTTADYIKLHEVTLRENPDTAGLTFGENDTYLQLSNPLASTPEGIEVSIKKDEIKKEWLVRSGSNTVWSGWGAGITSSQTTYATVSHTDTDTTDDVMEQGTEYVKIDLATGKTFNFANTVSTSVPNSYQKNDLALSFWYYTSTGALPGGTILLSSNGGTTYYLSWTFNSHVTSLNTGWNKITLPFSARNGYSDYTGGDSGIDITKINYIRWIGQTATEEAMTMGISDINVVPCEEEEEIPQEWVVRSGSNTVWSGWGAGITSDQTTYSTVSHTDADTADDVMKQGTEYVKIDLASGKTFNFANTVDAGVTAGYERDDVALSFWYYTSTGAAPNGEIFLSSVGSNESDGYYLGWNMATMVTDWSVGWNQVVLPMKECTKYSTGWKDSGLDISNIVYIRWINQTATAEETTMGLSDIKVTLCDGVTPKASVTTTEITDPTTIVNKSMIFSNSNLSGEIPYALYITDKGYPALLWGTSEYTLNYNVCTGDWANLKVVRNADNYIDFYVDGELRGTSTATETDSLTAFTTAHCIAVDGTGSQMFEGSIMNLRIYSDNACVTTMGSWNLRGDTQYVLTPMQDTSANANHAVYRGTRANDWVSYESVKTQAVNYVGENYWSMVFIPDIQNLAQTAHGYDKIWYQMADWIADNIGAENIKHVIGAGDNTWSNVDSEYQIAQNGFNKFKDLVSWSNMSGNHEFGWGSSDNRTSTLYNTYFGEDYIKGSAAKDTYMGYYQDPKGYSTTENSYYRFNVNGVNWMILQLEYYPRLSVLDWAKSIAEEYPQDNIILTTHGYLTGNQSSSIWPYVNETRDYLAVGDGDDYLGASTKVIWDKLNTCTNIKMILNGHATTGTGSIVWHNETNSDGVTVPALMINAQDLDLESNGDGSHYFSDQPLGMLSILRFSEDGTKATVQLYCPKYEMSFDPINPHDNAREEDGRDSNNIQLSFVNESFAKKYTSFEAGTAPETVEGYAFAGWFTDETCKNVLKSETEAEVAYAKFVDADILNAKAQVKNEKVVEEGTNLVTYKLPDDMTDIRFITSVDSLEYKNVGFKIVINGKTTMTTDRADTTKQVYRKIYAVGNFGDENYIEEYTPEGTFSPQSEYFKTFTIRNVEAANYDTEIEVTPYWITLDGTYVYGETTVKTISDPDAVAQ